MNRTQVGWIAGGLGAGAAAAFLLDPRSGRRRRALIRDKAKQAAHLSTFGLAGAVSKTWRDIANRARGAAAETRSAWKRDYVADDVLVERVRSKIGRAVSHPGSIQVAADDGRITLRGEAPATEVDRLVSAVRSVRGVSEVSNRLKVDDRPRDVPGLRGGRLQWLESSWSPAARVAAGVAGGALTYFGATHRNALGYSLGAVGMGMLARGITNRGVASLASAGGNGR